MDADLAFRAVCRALVLPPLGPILLGVAGLLLLRRRPRTGRALVALALATLLVLSVPVASDALNRAVEDYPPLDLTRPVAADVIVVLGGGIRHDAPPEAAAEPTAATLERLAEAAGIARATGLPLLLSGGVVEPGPAEADAMQATLRRDFGLEARWLERRSRTTRENAVESAALLRSLGLTRVVLVTSAAHLRRSVAEFHAVGIEVVPAPAGVTGAAAHGLGAWLPKASALLRSQAALYELAGGLVARVGRGR